MMEANGKITEIIAIRTLPSGRDSGLIIKGSMAEKKMSCKPSPLLKYLMNKEE